MHAVVVRVSIDEPDRAQSHLDEEVVPTVSQAPGFQAGYWSRSEDGSNGLAFLAFESEEAARRAHDIVTGPDGPAGEGSPVTLQDAEVREVLASA